MAGELIKPLISLTKGLMPETNLRFSSKDKAVSSNLISYGGNGAGRSHSKVLNAKRKNCY